MDKNWEAIGLFATPLAKVRLQGADQLVDFFHTHINKPENMRANHQRPDRSKDLTHFHHETSVFSVYPQLDAVRASIENAGTFVYQELLNYKKSGTMQVTNAWFNLAEIGASQGAHTHANCRLCGTLYLTTDENTVVQFYHPQSNASQHVELFDQPDEDSPNNYGLSFHHPEVKVKVRAGDCLFWPPYLKHGYENNQTPNRLSLSFNLMPRHLNTLYQVYAT